MIVSEKDAQRFWTKVDIRGQKDCWNWTANATPVGYGRFQLNRRNYAATHIVLALDSRPRRDNMQALHSCDNPRCVNPSHLRWGTHDDNMQDKMERGRCSRLTGIAHPRSHLNTEEMREKKEFILNSGLSIRDCAKHLGIGQTTIFQIRNGLKWRLVDPVVGIRKPIRASSKEAGEHRATQPTGFDEKEVSHG